MILEENNSFIFELYIVCATYTAFPIVKHFHGSANTEKKTLRQFTSPSLNRLSEMDAFRYVVLHGHFLCPPVPALS